MPLKTIRDEEPQMNLTSMIDVLFLLVIFFMAVTKFAEDDRRLPLHVPTISDRGALSAAPDPKVINVYQDGEITIGNRTVSIPELTGQLAAARSQYKDLAVLIRGDKMTTHGRMTEVYSACRQAGVAELAISVKLDTTKR